jgi:hypothetical protein
MGPAWTMPPWMTPYRALIYTGMAPDVETAVNTAGPAGRATRAQVDLLYKLHERKMIDLPAPTVPGATGARTVAAWTLIWNQLGDGQFQSGRELAAIVGEARGLHHDNVRSLLATAADTGLLERQTRASDHGGRPVNWYRRVMPKGARV